VAQRLLHVFAWVAIAVAASSPASAQAHSPTVSPFVAAHPALQASLERIAQRSPLWREAAAAIQKAGRRAVVVTPDRVTAADAADSSRHDGFDDSVLAEVTPIVEADASVDVVVVVINLALLEKGHRDRQLPAVEFERDLDRILVHEVYGHAVPYLLEGHISGRCADPRRGERASDACSIKRENDVRAELRLGRRMDYSLDDLSVSRRHRD
jgi:hypothetical protein